MSDSNLRHLFDRRFTAYLFVLVLLGGIAIGMMKQQRVAPSFGSEMQTKGSPDVAIDPEKKSAFAGLLAAQLDRLSIPADFFREHYDAFGPETMIAVLDENRFCHSEAHNLGRVIYEQERDLATATNICQSQCSSGCIHGVLMGLFAEKTDPEKFADPEHHATIADLTSEFKAEIASMCIRRSFSAHLSLGDCYHAIGHALMVLANYDIPEALGLCSIFDRYGLGAKYYCATGVYMERDIEFGNADAEVSDIHPCDANEYPVACFRYKIRRAFDVEREIPAAIQLCANVPNELRPGCYHGLGYGAWRQIYENPRSVNMICASENATEQRLCLEGVFGYTNLYDRSIAKAACDVFSVGDRAVCDAAAQVHNFQMNLDFAPYAE